MADLSISLRRKLDYYTQAGTWKTDALTGAAKEKAIEHLRTKALEKIKGVTDSVREDIRAALISAQSTGQPLLATASTIIGSSDLPRGSFATARKRAVAIAKNELRSARQVGLLEDGVEKGEVYFTWVCIFAKGSCSICIGRHGNVHTAKVWQRLGIPPSPHPGCGCSLIPGKGIPIPPAMTRTEVRKMGVSSRIFRQVTEQDYVKTRKSFIDCTNKTFGWS